MSAETTTTTAQPTFDRVLADYTRRCRAQLLLRAGLFMVLAAACGGVGTWRLLAAQVHAVLQWAPAATAAALVLAVGVWSALRWRSAGGAQAADYLDRTLGLEERLSTAMEFSGVENPPALYEELLRDTTTRLGRVRTRQSRALAYGGALLALLLLVLIFWPNARPLLPLAKLSEDPKSASPEPDDKDSEEQGSNTDSNASEGTSPDGSNAPSGDSGDAADSGDAGESGGSGESDKSQGESGGPQQEGGAPSGNAQQDPGGANSPQQNQESGSGAGENQQNAGQGQSRDQGQPSPEARQPDKADKQSGSAQAKNGGKGQPQSGQGKSDAASGASDSAQQKAQKSSSGGGKEGSASAPQKAQAGGQPQSDDGGSGKQGPGQAGLAQAAQGLAQQGAGNINPANQEAMKAEIRQLLKEISAEVKDIQDQLSKSQPPPVPGAGTDPEIYGEDSPMPPVPAGEGNVPLQLKTDEAPTQSGRTGGGVGKASGEVSDDAPKAKAEAANLSDDPVEETPVSRQSIPAEYRGVFDKLHQR